MATGGSEFSCVDLSESKSSHCQVPLATNACLPALGSEGHLRSPSGSAKSSPGSMSATSSGGTQGNQLGTPGRQYTKQESSDKKRKGNPYIPSYMDPMNGPEPCVVCSDAATGYHYRCMTCEGCKGFFRRTIQKNLVYSCKWNANCSVDKNTRNQCQKCRYEKCIRVGMATDLVLNEKQRLAKRRLIEDNRAKRRSEQSMDNSNDSMSFSSSAPSSNTPVSLQQSVDIPTSNPYQPSHHTPRFHALPEPTTPHPDSMAPSMPPSYHQPAYTHNPSPNTHQPQPSLCIPAAPPLTPGHHQTRLPTSNYHNQFSECVTQEDRNLISEIRAAYANQAYKATRNAMTDMVDQEDINQLKQFSPKMFKTLTQLMTPAIRQVVEFAKAVPGFGQLDADDQTILLKGCCLDIICLKAACRFDRSSETLVLHSGLRITQEKLNVGSVSQLIAPIYHFAVKLARLELDDTEVALLAAVLLMTSDRSGLHNTGLVDQVQERILASFKHYQAEMHPHQQVHWARTLMTVTELRTISTRHAERVLAIRLDTPDELPPLFLEMFGGSQSSSSSENPSGSSTSQDTNLVPPTSSYLSSFGDPSAGHLLADNSFTEDSFRHFPHDFHETGLQEAPSIFTASSATSDTSTASSSDTLTDSHRTSKEQ